MNRGAVHGDECLPRFGMPLHPLSVACGPVAARVPEYRVFAQVRPRATSELRHLVPCGRRPHLASSAAAAGSNLSPKARSRSPAGCPPGCVSPGQRFFSNNATHST